jgi:hypothetical protein
MAKGAAELLPQTGGPVQQELARFAQSQSCAARARTLANAAATEASNVIILGDCGTKVAVVLYQKELMFVR